MKNISTGFGLCVLGLGIAAWPVLDRLVPRADAGIAHPVATVAAAATAQVATAQVAPTIVWYGVAHNGRFAFCSGSCSGTLDRSTEYSILFRAWSDGRVEAKKICTGDSCAGGMSPGGWIVVSDPNQGYNAAADLDFNGQVDGADLAAVLNDWGNAPRHDISPSSCPLNLINPR